MATDISKLGGLIKVTESGVNSKSYTTESIPPYQFTSNGELIFAGYLIPLADLRIAGSGTAPANVAAAQTALDALFPNAGGAASTTYLSKTYAEIVALINADGLIQGTLYKISDRGDRGLFFTAISTNQLSKDGTRLMLCPATYAATTDGSGNIWDGVWASSKTANANELMIWGALVWRNLTGAIGTADSDTALDAVNWEVISKASFSNNEYIVMEFSCRFDVVNDWIERQWDSSGNEFGISYWAEQNYWVYGYNMCDISDWNYGSAGNLFIQNKCGGVFNNNVAELAYNYADDRIMGNNLTGQITQNKVADGIYNNIGGKIQENIIIGGISNNSIGGQITFNWGGSIENNTITGTIDKNMIPKKITGNSNLGDIALNRNNGQIANCGSGINLCNIVSNINNGNISGTFAADVTDTIINKT